MHILAVRRFSGLAACTAIFLLSSLQASAQEFLVDPGFEDTQGLGVTGAPWREPLFANPAPDVNVMADPRNGLEHAAITYDSNQSGAFGPTIGSSAYVGFGPAEEITDFTGMMFTVTGHYKVVANNMVSPNPANAPSILIRTYVAYFNDPVGFLGYGGFAPDFPADVYVDGTNDAYQEVSYEITVPTFVGMPVTSIEFTHGLVAPQTDDFRVMTGSATVYFDDASLSIPSEGLPGDYNNDGQVDAADYAVWRKNVGTSFELNGNGDETGTSGGVVDSADYDYWKANFGSPSAGIGGAAAHLVPEPAGLFLVCVIVLAAINCRLGR